MEELTIDKVEEILNIVPFDEIQKVVENKADKEKDVSMFDIIKILVKSHSIKKVAKILVGEEAGLKESVKAFKEAWVEISESIQVFNNVEE